MCPSAKTAMSTKFDEAKREASVWMVVNKRPKDLQPNEVLARYANARPKRKNKHWLQTGEWLMVPPNLGRRLFGPPAETRIRMGEAAPDFVPDSESVLCPELHQPEAFAAVRAQVATTGAAVLQMPTGCGKTLLALHLAASWGRRTLVLVHKEDILSGWIETCDIHFPRAKVGIVRQQRLDLANGCDVVVAMVQTLQRRAVEEADLAQFGTVIVDEAHHYGSSYSQLLAPVFCAHMLALSATPERTEGPVLDWWFGGIAYTFSRPKGHTAVRKILYHRPERRAITRMDRDGTAHPDCTEMLKALAADDERNELLVDAIVRDTRKHLAPGEGVLCLTAFRDHAHRIAQGIESRGVDVGVWLGAMRSEEAKAAKAKTIIVSTYECAGEGTNIPRLRRMWMLLPRSFVTQSVGRVVRGVCDHIGYVHDVVDDYSIFATQWYNRARAYAACGIVVDEHTTLEVASQDE